MVKFGVETLSCEPSTPKTYIRSTTRKTFEEGNNTPGNWRLTPRTVPRPQVRPVPPTYIGRSWIVVVAAKSVMTPTLW